jgi:hypothetical protein
MFEADQPINPRPLPRLSPLSPSCQVPAGGTQAVSTATAIKDLLAVLRATPLGRCSQIQWLL